MSGKFKLRLTKQEIKLLETELSMAKSMKLFDDRIVDSILDKIFKVNKKKKIKKKKN